MLSLGGPNIKKGYLIEVIKMRFFLTKLCLYILLSGHQFGVWRERSAQSTKLFLKTTHKINVHQKPQLRLRTNQQIKTSVAIVQGCNIALWLQHVEVLRRQEPQKLWQEPKAVWFLGLDDEILSLSEWVTNPLGLRQTIALQIKTRSAKSFKVYSPCEFVLCLGPAGTLSTDQGGS